MGKYNIRKFSPERQKEILKYIKNGYVYQIMFTNHKLNRRGLYMDILGHVDFYCGERINRSQEFFDEWCEVNSPSAGGNPELFYIVEWALDNLIRVDNDLDDIKIDLQRCKMS
jgi:hypothetical protein